MHNKFDAVELIEKIENFNYLNLDIKLDNNLFIKNRVIPFERGTNSIFCFGLEENYNFASNIKYMTGMDCEFRIIESDLFEFLFDRYLSISNKTSNGNDFELFTAMPEDDNKNLRTINYLNTLIENAILRGVSDIHIEPFKDEIRIRFRLDGKLISQDSLPKELLSIIITRIKILSKLDISEKRLPQDGRITFEYNNRDIDLRISTIPTIYGEKIALRILDSEFKFKTLESLGLDKDSLDIIKKEITRLSGMILVCGPTNSGKTTTIYSILNQINNDEVNIVTMEDPVEYKIHGINQIQINYKTGLEFVNTLNHILRQDPQIISLGEIRDEETVKTALRAAITGHLLLSTLHTSDSISAINRLKDMKGEDYLISNALKVIISQRLVRRLCDFCKEEYLCKSSLFEKEEKIFRAIGCTKCNGGYKGRVGIFEVLKIDNKIKSLIEQGANYDEILQSAKDDGFITLRDNLIKCVLNGTTSLEEVIKII